MIRAAAGIFRERRPKPKGKPNMKYLRDSFKHLLKWSGVYILIAYIIDFVDRKVGLPTLHKFGDYVRDSLGRIPIYGGLIIIAMIFLFIIVFDEKQD